MSSAQVSLYGIGDANQDAALTAALDALQASGLPHEVGGMSTLIDSPDDARLFAALQAMYAAAARQGAVVMQATISNACPVSLPPEA